MNTYKPLSNKKIEEHEALIDEEIRRYLDQHSGDEFDEPLDKSENVV